MSGEWLVAQNLVFERIVTSGVASQPSSKPDEAVLFLDR